MKNRHPLSLYVHIPFCVRKCHYCDFLSFPEGRPEYSQKDIYVNSLLREINSLPERFSAKIFDSYEISTVFFGGGTPNTLSSELLISILCKLKSLFLFSPAAEISVELNPGVFPLLGRSEEKELAALKAAGFNRLSIGAQSLRPKILSRLGRIHDADAVFSLFHSARKSGFENISFDLMSSLPDETPEEFLEDLKRLVSLSPEHLSVYSLIIEPDTPFGRTPSLSLSLPDEETELLIDRKTREYLKSQGYERYEISNYALPGRECAHNLVYWNRGEYLGFGLGAASLFSGVRRTNTRDFSEYLCSPGLMLSEEHVLSRREAMEEFLFLGLRKTAGIRESDFLAAFELTLPEVFGPELLCQEKEGYLLHEDDVWRYNDAGLDVSTTLLSRFLA